MYDEKHSIANLMAASKQFDINPTHLASISGPDQNKNKEHLFNFHQLNQQLATVDPKTIRLRKRRYAEVYKVREKKDIFKMIVQIHLSFK